MRGEAHKHSGRVIQAAAYALIEMNIRMEADMRTAVSWIRIGLLTGLIGAALLLVGGHKPPARRPLSTSGQMGMMGCVTARPMHRRLPHRPAPS